MTGRITAHRERDQVRRVAAAWRAQYPLDGRQSRPRDCEATYERLRALDPETATADDVAAIIGNTSWARPATCHQCGDESWDAVTLGEERGYESSNATVCRACLAAALAVLEAPP